MAEFENMDHRLDKINATLKEYGMGTLDDAERVCKEAGMDPLPYDIVKSVQPICFEDAAWAYTAGAAIRVSGGFSAVFSVLECRQGQGSAWCSALFCHFLICCMPGIRTGIFL